MRGRLAHLTTDKGNKFFAVWREQNRRMRGRLAYLGEDRRCEVGIGDEQNRRVRGRLARIPRPVFITGVCILRMWA